MSRKSRALRAAHSTRETPRPVTRLAGPSDAATMIPYMLGFHPHESLVVVTLEGPGRRFGPLLRMDLVADESVLQAQTAHIMRGLRSARAERVLIVAYTDDPSLAEPLVRSVRAAIDAAGIGLEDALRVGEGRWWSYTCSNPDCCDPSGTPFDAGSSRVAAEAVMSGLAVVEDRDALRALFAEGPSERRAEVAREVARLRTFDVSTTPLPAALGMPARMEAAAARGCAIDASEAAWLALAVQSYLGRLAAIDAMDRRTADSHLDVWRTVMSLVSDELMPPVGSLAALAAWLDGRGVLASHALERVFAVAPHYPLARRLDDLLAGSVDPRTWPIRTLAGQGPSPAH